MNGRIYTVNPRAELVRRANTGALLCAVADTCPGMSEPFVLSVAQRFSDRPAALDALLTRAQLEKEITR